MHVCLFSCLFPLQLAGAVSGLKLEEKKEKIGRMKELTKADESTCSFYLESYDWDLERAVQEYFSK